MAEAPASNEPFNLTKLKELIELMEKHGVTEVSLKNGDEQWRLARGSREVFVPVGTPQMQMAAPAAMPAPAQTPAAAPVAPAPAVPSGPAIKSPTVGTFYSSPTPEDPAFVQVGSTVKPDTVVCIVEAMKVFNQITADVSGTITEVLVKNGDSVEYGQPLFRVKT